MATHCPRDMEPRAPISREIMMLSAYVQTTTERRVDFISTWMFWARAWCKHGSLALSRIVLFYSLAKNGGSKLREERVQGTCILISLFSELYKLQRYRQIILRGKKKYNLNPSGNSVTKELWRKTDFYYIPYSGFHNSCPTFSKIKHSHMPWPNEGYSPSY